MGLIKFIKTKLKLLANKKPVFASLETLEEEAVFVDRSAWTGADFEFLFIGNIEVLPDFDNMMTPNSLKWKKISRGNWDYYQVGEDEFSYSFEDTGIQMTFNSEILFEKAKKIADEVILNIIDTGQHAELLILNKRNVNKLH